MRRPGTDPENVQMADVLCDFCHAAWTEDRPFVEGHQGAIICGNCLAVGYVEVEADDAVTDGYACRLCLEGDDDRAALNRAGEKGWRSPVDPEAVACRRCLRLAAGTLHKDAEHAWTRPGASSGS